MKGQTPLVKVRESQGSRYRIAKAKVREGQKLEGM